MIVNLSDEPPSVCGEKWMCRGFYDSLQQGNSGPDNLDGSVFKLGHRGLLGECFKRPKLELFLFYIIFLSLAMAGVDSLLKMCTNTHDKFMFIEYER